MSLLPESVDLIIPGFKRGCTEGAVKTLALKQRNIEQWYNEFVDKVVDSCGREFIPVFRIGDGEFLFFLGEGPLDIRLSFFNKLIYNFPTNQFNICPKFISQ